MVQRFERGTAMKPKVKSLSISRILAASMLTLGLSGCAVLGGGTPALDTFTLTAPSINPGQKRARLQLLIAEPVALKALDNENIVISPRRDSIEYLKGAQWADRLPRVVQARLAEGFQRSGHFAGVGRPGEGLAIDYQVTSDIRRFEIDVSRGNVAVVELYVRLLNDRNGTVKAEKSFVATVPFSASTGNAAYISALDKAFDQVGSEIVSWTIAAL